MSKEQDAASIRVRLAEPDAEREARTNQLGRLELGRTTVKVREHGASPLSADLAAAEKIALFRKLFAGRSDVFPARWKNRNTGKSGYAPACANEWVRGVSEKPRVRCGECPNQAFIPVSDKEIAGHLRGADRARSRDTAAGMA